MLQDAFVQIIPAIAAALPAILAGYVCVKNNGSASMGVKMPGTNLTVWDGGRIGVGTPASADIIHISGATMTGGLSLTPEHWACEYCGSHNETRKFRNCHGCGAPPPKDMK